jgi:hypothetical protein
VAEEGHGSSAATEERVAEETRQWRYEKLVQKYMLIYCCLASEEERAAMAEPNCWRPAIPSNLEEQIGAMEARLASLRQPPPPPPPAN